VALPSTGDNLIEAQQTTYVCGNGIESEQRGENKDASVADSAAAHYGDALSLHRAGTLRLFGARKETIH
jgi:hypothetical protein